MQGTEAGQPGRVKEDASRSRAASCLGAAACDVAAEALAGTCGQQALLCQGLGGHVSEDLFCWGTLAKLVEIETFSKIMLFFPPLRGALNKKCPQKM